MTPKEIRLDINLLRVLESIHANGGISSAARALHLTQPAITHALNRLREMLNDPLFVRQGNKMVPTHKTRTLIPKIQFYLSGLYAAISNDLEFDCARLDATFIVGFRDVAESIILPVLIRKISKEAPRVKIVSRRVWRDDVARELISGAIDLMIDRSVHTDDRIHREYLREEDVAVVMRLGHPLASGQLHSQDYLSARHIVVAPHAENDPLDMLLAERGKIRDIGLVCQHYFSACQVVAESDWILTMPSRYAYKLSQVLQIVVRPMPMNLKPMRIELYWHMAREDDPAHRWFRGLVAETLRMDKDEQN